ncbi:DsbA family oxidoreductase [Pelagibacteraceae bacterium]|jgi:predicted DsbA family dithiol-disulfide isomerase|nr:DsbA family oxidoreductase [Pelagibacteraceae bacterium]
MEIKMFSDTICGWCYIGKERLKQALREVGGNSIQVTNLPFQLNPDMPMEGMDRIQYIKKKFGSIENAKPMYDNMILQGQQENLEIKLDKIKKTPNTVKSHLLIDYAKLNKVENEVMDSIFESYFFKAKDIGDENVLLEIGKKHDLDIKGLEKFITQKENLQKIDKLDTIAKQMGISGVPFYIFNDKISISGAETVENLTQAINKSLNG